MAFRIQAPAAGHAVEGIGRRPSDLVVVAGARSGRIKHHEVPGFLLERGALGQAERVDAIREGRIAQCVHDLKRRAVRAAVEDSDPNSVRVRGVCEHGPYGREVVAEFVAAGTELHRLSVLCAWIFAGFAHNRADGIGFVQIAEHGTSRRRRCRPSQHYRVGSSSDGVFGGDLHLDGVRSYIQIHLQTVRFGVRIAERLIDRVEVLHPGVAVICRSLDRDPVQRGMCIERVGSGCRIEIGRIGHGRAVLVF